VQSIVDEKATAFHVAIIMDGNGRWATRRGLPRSAGHQAGVRAARLVTQAAPDLGVTTLSLFAFSSDNWRRPRAEVNALMSLLRHYLACELRHLVQNGIRLTVIGRRDRLPAGLRTAIQDAEEDSAKGTRLNLRIAIDYSSRDAIIDTALRSCTGPAPSRDAFGRMLAPGGAGTDVDLLIRSGGEKRLSDFLLWECAYAELLFLGPTSTPTIWPRPLPTSGAANDASAGCRAPRRSRRPNNSMNRPSFRSSQQRGMP